MFSFVSLHHFCRKTNIFPIFSVNVKKYGICLLSDYSALSKVWFRRLALVVRKVGNAIPWIVIYRVDSVMQPSNNRDLVTAVCQIHQALKSS